VLDREMERALAAKSIADVNAILNSSEDWREHTQGNGFDIVFDATGNQKSMEKSFDYAAHGGRYVLVGVIRDSITFQDPDFHRKELTLLASRNATSGDFQRVIAAIGDGHVPVDRLITHRTSLADAVSDIPVWAVQKAGLIKAVIEID
jgi:threonine dehydrogenase-like Zn-dependent dehydrogenase